MKRTTWMLVLLVFCACDKAASHINFLDGTYIGYFHRNEKDTAQVRIKFSANLYEGFSSKTGYPELCRGSFDQKEKYILFIDSCNTRGISSPQVLPVRGNFNYDYGYDGAIRIWRKNGTTMDEFILKKI